MFEESQKHSLRGENVRSTKNGLLILILGLGIVAGVALGFSAMAGRPIRFTHHKHVNEVGLSCDDCHIYVKTHPFAGLPELELCLTCHEEPQTDSPEEEKLRTFQAEGGELLWRRIYRVPDHVYFSHRRHVTLAEMECATCHGHIAERKKPPARQEIRISMERCMKCHQQENVDNDCLSCHK